MLIYSFSIYNLLVVLLGYNSRQLDFYNFLKNKWMATNIWGIVHMIFKSAACPQVITHKNPLLLSTLPTHVSPPPPSRTIPHPEWDWKGHSFLYNMQLRLLIMHIAPNHHVQDYSSESSAEQLQP